MNTSSLSSLLTLESLAKGTVAYISGIALQASHTPDLERRLLEMGFTEGSRVEILHEGFPRRDPLAVRVDDMLIALRRQEAAALQLTLSPPK